MRPVKSVIVKLLENINEALPVLSQVNIVFFANRHKMFSTAMNYLAGAASSAVAAGASSASTLGTDLIGQDDPLVGSVVDVGDIRVFIRRRIGEGGFAFVYFAEDMADRSKAFALKRLLVNFWLKHKLVKLDIADFLMLMLFVALIVALRK